MYYYAVERSENCLAHYGVKGMRWGVRRAIQRGNDKKLSRQYQKAEKKLKKLSAKADIEMQKLATKKHTRKAAVAAGIGLAGLGALTGNKLAAKKLAEDTITILPLNKKSARKKRIVEGGKGIYKTGEGLGTGPVGDRGSEKILVNGGKSNVNPNGFRSVDKLTKGITVAGLGTAAYQGGKALAAKYRTTNKGHAKAVAKRDSWKREMQKAFKGTKYSASKRRRKRNG